MVGVPGKSKGCSTCRRRKKGCDQKRPICGQCAASGYVCGGYQRDLTFVLHPASKTVEKATFLPIKPHLSLLGLTPSLERSALVLQCQSVFYDVYLPHGRCMVNDQFILKCGRPRNWTHVLQSYPFQDTSLELAFAAFSISRVGRSKDDPRMVKESTKFYGKALKTLQKALYDPSRMHSEQVLAACLLLGLYEMFEGAVGKSVGWVSHAQGAARIVELRGPERHIEQPAHTLFLGTRLPIIYSAILRRKKSFMSDEDWLTTPWSQVPKTGLDRLVDIIACVPALLEQFDNARSHAPVASQLQALQACLSYCRHLQKSLLTWNAIRRPNSEAIIVAHDYNGLEDNYPFAQELHYDNHLFLNANLIHWSAGLVIANTVSEIEFLLASFGVQPTSMLSSTAFAMQEAKECATKVAQSIPYCLWPDMGDIGIDYIQFPMCLAFQYFMKSNNSQVCSWMLEKSNEMQKNVPASSSSKPSSPTYVPGDVPLGLFAAQDLSTQSGVAQTYSSFVTSTGPPSVSTVGVSSGITNITEPSFVIPSKVTPINGSSDARVSTTGATDIDFDADYDLDSDLDFDSSQSNGSGPPSDSSSRHGSGSGPSGAKARLSCGLSVDPGDFTFIQENPSRYYIDRSEMIVLDKP